MTVAELIKTKTLVSETKVVPVELPPLKEQTPAQQVARVLDQIVQEFGYGYVYQKVWSIESSGVGCFYQKNGSPSCIVGQILHKMGFNVAQLKGNVNHMSWRGFAYENTPYYGEIPAAMKDRKVFDALQRLQQRQDEGMTWGEAVHIFKGEVGV